MKVIHILNYSWENGGSSKVVHDIAQRQQKEGFEVSIFSIDKTGHRPYIEIEGVEIVLLQPHFLAKLLPLFSTELYKALKNRHFDIIHLHGLWNFSLLAAYILGLAHKTMITIHGCLNPFTFKCNALKRAIFTYGFQRRFMKEIKMIHVFHEKEKEYVKNYLGEHPNIEVLANGIDLDAKFELKKDRFSSNKVLFLSRLDPIKGLDLLLPAFLQVIQNIPGATLQIAGPDFGMLAYVQAFIEKHNVAQNVQYLGVLTGKAKKEVQDKANAFILPSYSEGFSIAVLEALHEGIPVLVSTETGLSEDITDYNAGTIFPFEIEAIAQCILNTLENTEESKKQVENGQKMLSEKFDIRKILDKMIAFNYQFESK